MSHCRSESFVRHRATREFTSGNVRMVHWSDVAASFSGRFEKIATFISRQLSVIFAHVLFLVNSGIELRSQALTVLTTFFHNAP